AVIGSVSLPVDGSSGVRSMRQDTQLWAVLGEQPVFEAAAGRWNAASPNSLHLVRLEPDVVIPSAVVLDGFDLVVMNAAAPISQETAQSLQGWVQRGGRLVVAVGDGVAALGRSPLADWLPLRPVAQTDMRNLGGLNAVVPN